MPEPAFACSGVSFFGFPLVKRVTSWGATTEKRPGEAGSKRGCAFAGPAESHMESGDVES